LKIALGEPILIRLQPYRHPPNPAHPSRQERTFTQMLEGHWHPNFMETSILSPANKEAPRENLYAMEIGAMVVGQPTSSS